MLYKQHTQSKLHTNGTDKQWISFKKTFFKSLLRSATVSACSGYSSSYSSGAIKAGLYAKKCAATCTCHCLGWVFSVVRERGGDQNHSAHQAFFFPSQSNPGVLQYLSLQLFSHSLLSWFCLRQSFSAFIPPSPSLCSCSHLPTCSLTHSGLCQTGNVPGIYTVEPTGGLAPHYDE